MTATKTRGQAIAAYCKACIHDAAASGNWKEQVSVCPATDCPLWQFRPVGSAAPAWIKSHDPADLPKDWLTVPQADAVARIRPGMPALPDSGAVQASCQTYGADPLPVAGATHCVAEIGANRAIAGGP